MKLGNIEVKTGKKARIAKPYGKSSKFQIRIKKGAILNQERSEGQVFSLRRAIC